MDNDISKKRRIDNDLINIHKLAMSIFDQCINQSGFVCWRSSCVLATRLVDEVLPLLKEYIRIYPDNVETAFDLSLKIYGICANADIDLDDLASVISDEFCCLWVNLINGSDDELRNYILCNLSKFYERFNVENLMVTRIEYVISDLQIMNK